MVIYTYPGLNILPIIAPSYWTGQSVKSCSNHIVRQSRYLDKASDFINGLRQQLEALAQKVDEAQTG